MTSANSSQESELQKELSAKLGVMASEQQERLAQHRANKEQLPYVNLTVFPIDPDVLEIIEKPDSEATSAVLFYKKGKDIRLGAVNPLRNDTKALVEKLTKDFGTPLHVYVISQRSLTVALSRYRRQKAEQWIPQDEIRVEESDISEFERTLADLNDLGQHIAGLPPSEILKALVVGAVRLGASDIHIEPKEKNARLRYRIDGVLQDVTAFDRQGWQLILSRVKVLSNLKLNVHEMPQDGSFVLRVGEETFDMRVSVLPGDHGENIVIRLLNRKAEAADLKDLGMKERDLKVVRDELRRVNGMILVTGPTGSGKTTTIASFLKEVNHPESKIITLEDPIEYRVPGIEQTEVDYDAGYTFAVGLRSILRQDPDVIMVGEMRDEDTAETAINAALTGHLVFSTLHTNNAAGAVPRLVEMGIKPFIIGPALNMVIAQRLVRLVCKDCAQEYKPDAKQLEQIRDAMEGINPEYFNESMLKNSNLTFVKAKGCKECNMTGYKGRVAVFEIFTVHGEMEELVLKGVPEARIQELAQKQGMTTIAQDGYLKVLEKLTTIEEVERISEE